VIDGDARSAERSRTSKFIINSSAAGWEATQQKTGSRSVAVAVQHGA